MGSLCVPAPPCGVALACGSSDASHAPIQPRCARPCALRPFSHAGACTGLSLQLPPLTSYATPPWRGWRRCGRRGVSWATPWTPDVERRLKRLPPRPSLRSPTRSKSSSTSAMCCGLPALACQDPILRARSLFTWEDRRAGWLRSPPDPPTQRARFVDRPGPACAPSCEGGGARRL